MHFQSLPIESGYYIWFLEQVGEKWVCITHKGRLLTVIIDCKVVHQYTRELGNSWCQVEDNNLFITSVGHQKVPDPAPSLKIDVKTCEITNAMFSFDPVKVHPSYNSISESTTRSSHFHCETEKYVFFSPGYLDEHKFATMFGADKYVSNILMISDRTTFKAFEVPVYKHVFLPRLSRDELTFVAVVRDHNDGYCLMTVDMDIFPH